MVDDAHTPEPAGSDRYRRLVERMPVVVFELANDPELHIRYTSPATERLTGYDVETWTNDRDLWRRVILAADRARVLSAWSASLKAGTPFEAEYRLVRRDGTLAWVRETLHPLTDDDGTLTGWQGVMLDISEQRFAEEAATRSESRYRNLVEHLPAVVYVDSAEIQPRSLYVSPSSTEILGYSPADYLRDAELWKRTIHPDDVERVGASWARVVHHERSFAEEYRFLRPDGTIVWVRDSSVPVEDDEGKLICWQGVILDVTAQKEIEEELRRSETRYRTLVEEVPATVYACTDEPEPRILFVSSYTDPANSAIRERRAPDDRSWKEAIHPDDVARVAEAWLEAVRTGAAFDEEYRYIFQNGDVAWVHDVCRVVRRDDTRPRFRQGVMLDVSHTKIIEEELRTSERRYRALVEQMPVIVYLDAGAPETETSYVSPNVLEILGRPARWFMEDLSRWYDILHPEDHDRVIETWRAAWRSRTDYHQEFRFVRPDGDVVWVRDSAHVVNEPGGDMPAWQGVLVDITAQKLAEEEVRSSEQRYRALVEQVPAVVYEMGPGDERHTLYVSPHVEAILGYTRQEWLDQPDIWMELLDEEDREVELAAHDLHNESGAPWDREYRLIASDGRRVWIRDQASRVDDPSTGEARWYGVMLDITAQKDAEEALRLVNDDLEFRVLTRTAELEDTNELMALEIGERRRAEKALHLAQRRYRDLIEDLPAVVYAIETNRRDRHEEVDEPIPLPYMSPKIRDMVGYTPQEWQQVDFWKERLHPHDRKWVSELADRSAATGEPFTAEYRFLAKDGHIVWVLDRATLRARDSRGLPAHFQGVMLDITARKEAEAKAEAAEERYRQLAEEGPISSYVFHLDPDDGRIEIEYISPQVGALIGFPLEELRADPTRWLEIVHPDDRERVEAALRQGLETGAPWAHECRIIRGDGAIAWVLNQATVVRRDDAGRPSRFQGAIMDITAQRLPLAGLTDSEASLRGLVEGLPGIPWTEVVDPGTGHNRFTYIGPQCLDVLGYTPHELLAEQTHFTRLVHPDDRARADAVSKEADMTGVWSDRFRAIGRDGSVRFLRGAGRRTVTEDGMHIWHGVTFDETGWVVSFEDEARGHARADTDAASPEAPPSHPAAGGSPATR
jgi:PAS domain S-box-containing protein